jgi:hypothetical protein
MYIQTKNPNFGKFWRVLEWKIWVDFMTIWNILRPFGIVCGYFFPFWYVRTTKNLATLASTLARPKFFAL